METGFGDGLGSNADPSILPVVSAPTPRPPGSGGFIPAPFSMSFVRCHLAVCHWLTSCSAAEEACRTQTRVFGFACSLTSRLKLYHLQQVQIIRETNDISTYVAGNFSFLLKSLSPAIVRPKVNQFFPSCSLI